MRTIPATWRPIPSTLVWAKDEASKHSVSIDLDFELDFFRDYYISKGASYADWDAAFRNWIRREIKEQLENKPVQAGSVKKAQTYASIKRAE